MTVAIAFGQIDITPAGFSAMAEHVKSELCRLLLDRGFKAMWISRTCGISLNDVVRLATARHKFVAGSDPVFEKVDHAPAPVVDPNDKQQNAMLERLNTQCFRLLIRLPAMGPAYWKNSGDMERDLGIRSGNGMKAVNSLYEQRLIERRRAPRGFEQGWELTELGAKLRSTINEGDLPTIVEPQK